MNESIEASRMGVALIFFSAVLVFVLFSANVGKAMLGRTADAVGETTYRATYRSFQEFMTPDGTVVPAAAAYAFVGYNENHINKIFCYIPPEGTPEAGYMQEGNGMEDTCLRDHLKGYVNVRATYDNTTAQYDLYIRRTEIRQ